MKTIIISCFLCLLAFLPSAAQEKLSPKAEAFFKKAMSEINQRHVAWIKSTAKKVNEKDMSEAETRNTATQYGLLQNFNNGDIEALCFLVIMDARKSAQEDMKSILADLKAINEQKRQVRDLQLDFKQHKKDVSRNRLDSIKLVLNKQPTVQRINTGKMIQPVKPVLTNTTRKKQLATVSRKVTKEEIDKADKDIKFKLDSLNEMGETEAVSLQMYMDRQSKAMNTISNLLKKISESEDQIIQNMK